MAAVERTMKSHSDRNWIVAIALMALALGSMPAARAQIADLADVPLANSPSDTVLPNLMYTLDDSWSMSWDFMPDNVLNGPGAGGAKQNCKSCDSSSCMTAAVLCSNSPAAPFQFPGVSTWGEPPYYSAQFNQVYYNPDVSYAAAVNADGTSRGDIVATAAPNDAFLDGTTKNLTTEYPEIYYCTTSAPTAAQLTDTTVCRRNGINNISGLNYFLYWSNDATNGGYPLTSFRNRIVRYTGHPYYFRISPHEYCSDANLINCTLSGTPTGTFTFPAPVRYCSSTANAGSTAVMSDAATSATPKCRRMFDTSTYIYPRYGRFTRVDIVPGTATYAKGPNAVRPDCANATYCTYAEELQNFANWYGYYRTRMMMMKTATGRAFIPIDDRYRVGFITINPGSPVDADQYEPIATFDATQKGKFYTKLYDQDFRTSTPLRQALSRVGRHFAGVTNGINNGMPEDPITHSCQQNFALLTSDGYWNDSGTVAITPTGAAVGHQDQVPDTTDPIYVSRPTVTLDGEGTQTRDTTPLTVLQQVVCTGDSSVLGGSNNCDCTGNFKRVKQRTQLQSQTADKTDGQVTSGPTTSTTSTTYQDITACNATVVTRTIVTQQTMHQRCTGNAVINFGDGYGSVACGCGGTNRRIKRRVVDLTRVIVTTDGVTTSDTTTGGVPVFSNVAGAPPTGTASGNCVASGTALNAGPTLISNPTLSDTSTTTGSTITAANITISPNPRTIAGTTTTTVTAYGGQADTLADVAMYYYKNDLRTGNPLSKSENNVPTSDKDINDGQHMVTFGLGLGLKGMMEYTADYETNPNSDYAKIRSSATNCPWTPVAGRTCNWPLPTASSPSTLDDLWHAAVNGRGAFYSASDPNTLADGLSGALAALKIQTAAASASATSSPNITETDNYIYSSTFRTVKWDGEIKAQRIDPADGTVLPDIVWSAQNELDLKVNAAEAQATPTDGRTIKAFLKTAPTKLRDFTWTSLTAAEQLFFANKCTALSQCPLLTAAQQADANNGDFMVQYLRGRRTHEGTVFRAREHRLGDPVNATPAFVKAPRFSFADAVSPSYASFRSTNASRQGILYIAANDGMLHAFNGDTGEEMWAYVPKIVMPKLHKLATDNWDVRHEYNVDGSPQVMDIFDSAAGAWKTILVSGLNKGGRGYYALDVTNPSAPKGLWEACSDATLCAVVDSDMGYTYGYPIITKRAFDGKWVVLVTSGINNVTPGTGRGYLYMLDAITGAILQKVDTGAGDTATPSGFSKISAFANDFNINNTATYVYGGDLLGNLWRFDMSVNPPVVLKVAELKDGAGNPQSITARPELGVVNNYRVLYVGTGRYLGEDDLPDPASLTPPLPWAYQQSVYAIKDKGVAYGNIRTAGLVQQSIISLSATSRSMSTNAVDWATSDGWFVDLNPGNSSPGERVNLDPQLVLGTLVVATNVPNNTACSVGGDSWLYQFDYRSGSYVVSATGDLVAQKITGETMVGVVVVRLPTGVIKAIATGGTGEKRTIGVNVGGGGGSGRRVSWRELIQ
jgi:type IV pilus assembly protein PilY1